MRSLMLRLDLPPRLRAEAERAVVRCRGSVTFAANSLVQTLVPDADGHFAAPKRRVPAIFAPRLLRAESETSLPGPERTARAFHAAFGVIRSMVSDKEAVRLAGVCSWTRAAVFRTASPHLLSSPMVWTCPDRPARWLPPTAEARPSDRSNTDEGQPAVRELLRSMAPFQRGLCASWLSRTRACPWCAVAASDAGDGSGSCTSLRPAVFGFASAGVVSAVRAGRVVFGADFLPEDPWHWHCRECHRRLATVPVPRHVRGAAPGLAGSGGRGLPAAASAASSGTSAGDDVLVDASSSAVVFG